MQEGEQMHSDCIELSENFEITKVLLSNYRRIRRKWVSE